MNVSGRKLIAYRRVSTASQSDSGLGLEAQAAAIDTFVKNNNATLLATYTEVESGKRSDRPELANALSHAALSNAVLVVARLDRLARNTAFLSQLQSSGCDFVAIDNPHANKMILHILMSVAEHEIELVSLRTKAALGAYRARGGKLGGQLETAKKLSHDSKVKGAKRSGEVSRERANKAYTHLKSTLLEWKSSGVSLREMAQRLNDAGHTTRRQGKWDHSQVRSVLKRFSTIDAA